jgi:hypothetical protein
VLDLLLPMFPWLQECDYYFDFYSFIFKCNLDVIGLVSKKVLLLLEFFMFIFSMLIFYINMDLCHVIVIQFTIFHNFILYIMMTWFPTALLILFLLSPNFVIS